MRQRRYEMHKCNNDKNIVIWDNENITLDELAEKCETINYEILCTISARVPRKFIKE